MVPQPERGELREQLRGADCRVWPQEHGESPTIPPVSSALLESITCSTWPSGSRNTSTPPSDVTSFDLASEWETVARILDFVEKHRRHDDALPRVERDVQIVRYEPAFRDQVASSSVTSGNDATPCRVPRWKYHQNPYLDDPAHLLRARRPGGRDAGMYARSGDRHAGRSTSWCPARNDL